MKNLFKMVPFMIIAFIILAVMIVFAVPENLASINEKADENHNMDKTTQYEIENAGYDNYDIDKAKPFAENLLISMYKTTVNIKAKLKHIVGINLIYPKAKQKLNDKLTGIINIIETANKNYEFSEKLAELSREKRIERIYSVKTDEKIKIEDNELVEYFRQRNFEELAKKYTDHKSIKKYEPKYRYIIAYSCYEKEEYENAIVLLESIKKDDVLFYEYVLYYKAMSYYKWKEYENASEVFDLIRNDYPDFRLMTDVIYNQARSYVNNDYDSQIFFKFKDLNKNYSYLNVLMSKSYYNKEMYDKAIDYAFKVINSKNHNYIKQVFPVVEDIISKKINFSYSDKLKIAKAYFVMYEYHKALEMFQSISFKDKETEYDRLNHIGTIYWRLKNYEEATKIYENIKANYTGYNRMKAEYCIADILFSRKKYDEAIPKLKAIEENKKHSFRKEATKNLLHIYSEKKEYSEMFKYLRAMSSRYNIRYDTWQPYVVPLINAHEFEVIVRELPEYIKIANHSRFISQLYFWLGCSYEQLELWDNAYDSFKRSIESYNNHYYPSRSLFHIKDLYQKHIDEEINLSSDTISPYDIEKSIDKRLDEFLTLDFVKDRLVKQLSADEVKLDTISNQKSERAFALFEIGDIRNALGEWYGFYNGLKNKEKYLFYFTQLFHNSGIYHKAMTYSEMIVKNINAKQNENYIPKYLIKYLYPEYYKEYVEPISKEHDINKRLVYSVIREESRFYHLAVSWAGAEGLMQLMPSTGRWLSDKLDRKPYLPFNPYENIYLGTRFLTDLLARFDELLAVGAYNTGGGRMGRYVKSFYEDINIVNIEHFVENIPIKETRYYIIKVIGSYWVYTRLY